MMSPTINILSNYVKYFLHPFETHRELYRSREHGEHESDRPKLVDFISISWLFMMVKAMYALVFLYIGKKSSEYLLEQETISNLLGPGAAEIHRFIILFTIFEVILFPVALWFYAKFWGLIINFFCTLFDNNRPDKDQVVEEVVATSLTANMFLLVPIIGELGKYFSALFFLYAGLRENLKFSKVQSIVVLLGPLLLLLLFIFILFVYLFLIISML